MSLTIVIKRGEGPIKECDIPHTLHSFKAANELLRQWSSSAPQGGGYDKCDFRITDEASNFEYDGRYDLKHWKDETANLKAHVVGYLQYLAGESMPNHYKSQEEYLKHLRNFGMSDKDMADASEWAKKVESFE